MSLLSVKSQAIKLGYKAALILRKNSPEILLVGGIVGLVVSTVGVVKASGKAEFVLETAKDKMDNINLASDLHSEAYSQDDRRNEIIATYIETGVDFVKLYGPSVVLGIVSVSAILGSHFILRKRLLVVGAAYKAVQASFRDYRKRVVEEYGEDKDKQFRFGTIKQTIETTVTDENGKKKKTKEEIDVFDPTKISDFAKYFDESCKQWTKTPEYNMMFLKTVQNHMNDVLNDRGYVWLNEVYTALGILNTDQGAIVGWIKDTEKGGGDGFIDFGIFQAHSSDAARAFVNGYERSILLDFNVDGIIMDYIAELNGVNAKGSGNMWRDLFDYPRNFKAIT